MDLARKGMGIPEKNQTNMALSEVRLFNALIRLK
jgi:hypothetical protein